MDKTIKSKIAGAVHSLDDHTKEIIRKSSQTMVIKMLAMLTGMLTSIFLARMLGADGLGIINLGNQIISLIVIFCSLGLPAVVTKEVSISFVTMSWQRLNSILRTSWITSGLLAVLVSVFGFILSPFIANTVFNEPRLEEPLGIFFLALLPQILYRSFAAAINGIGKIWQSSLLQEALSIFIVGLVLFITYIVEINITVVYVAYTYAIARTIVFIATVIVWNSFRNESDPINFAPLKPLLKVALPILLIGAVNSLSSSVDILMLGWLLTAEDVGLYSIALRIALVSTFILQVTNHAVKPKIASMFASGSIKELERMLQNVTIVLAVFGAINLLAIIFYGNEILAIWGEDFKKGYWVLLIIGMGQFINISTGCVNLILTMCGEERMLGKVILLYSILNIGLNFLFIHTFGVEGAAMATALTIILQNVSAYVLVKKRLKINTIPYL